MGDEPSILVRIQSALTDYAALRCAQPRIVVLGKSEWWDVVKWVQDHKDVMFYQDMTTACFGVHTYIKTIAGVRVAYDIDTESWLDVYG